MHLVFFEGTFSSPEETRVQARQSAIEYHCVLCVAHITVSDPMELAMLSETESDRAVGQDVEATTSAPRALFNSSAAKSKRDRIAESVIQQADAC